MRNNKGKLLKSQLLTLKPKQWTMSVVKNNIFALMGMYEKMPKRIQILIDRAKNELLEDHVRDPYKKEPYSTLHSYVTFDESPNMTVKEYKISTHN